EAGSRVLLLEADLRHPRCHRTLGVDAARGLASVLAGQEELESVIHSLEAPRLSFIPAGAVPPNPAELMSSARMREIVASLRSRYDFVIIDTPPVLPVTDAVVLAREADAVVLVVRGHGTPSGLVREARDRLLMTGPPPAADGASPARARHGASVHRDAPRLAGQRGLDGVAAPRHRPLRRLGGAQPVFDRARSVSRHRRVSLARDGRGGRRARGGLR